MAKEACNATLPVLSSKENNFMAVSGVAKFEFFSHMAVRIVCNEYIRQFVLVISCNGVSYFAQVTLDDR